MLRCQYVSKDFHARLSPKGKLYRYRIWSGAVLPPFEYGRAWHIPRPLDFEVLKTSAKHFVGTHDFAGFAANRGKQEKSTIRTIYSVRVGRNGPCVTIDFDGDGFLYKMVRLIVGSLVQCALGKLCIEDVNGRLAAFDAYLSNTSWDQTYRRMRDLIEATVQRRSLRPAQAN